MKLPTQICKSVMGGLCGALIATAALAEGPHEAPMRDFAHNTVKGWISNPMIINAIKAQNAKHAGLSEADIIAMDNQWRAETGASSTPMIDSILANEVSKFLAEAKKSTQGMVTEIFVMDNKGLNVGQSDVTSDYWQGDEDKFQMSYGGGPNALFIDEVEKDESTQAFQSQLSMPVVDPMSGEVIGAITVGVDVGAL